MSEPAPRSGRAALVCHRSTPTGPTTAEWTLWTTTGLARQAEAELTPCGPLCVDVHSVVRLDLEPDPRRRPRGAAIHVARST